MYVGGELLSSESLYLLSEVVYPQFRDKKMKTAVEKNGGQSPPTVGKSREESLRSWICISPPEDGKVTLDHYTIKGQKSDT